jgi:hypothetical protein
MIRAKRYCNLIIRRFITFILLFSFSHNILCKDKATYGMGVKFGPSAVIYDTKTSNYLDNPMLISGDLYWFYRNIIIGIGTSRSYTYSHYIIKEIEYKDKKLTSNQRLRLDFSSVRLGYIINLKNSITLDPYIGLLAYWINDYEKENALIRVSGYCLNLELNKWFLSDKSLCIFIRDQFNITNLRKVNSNLGNYANIFEIGIGGRFGKLK